MHLNNKPKLNSSNSSSSCGSVLKQPNKAESNKTLNDFDLKTLLNNYIENESKYKYEFEYFLSVIKAKQVEFEFIDKLLDQLRQSVNILEPRLFEAKLISLIFFDIKWHTYYSNNKIILNKLSDFLIDLNSAYTGYINKCLTFLIKMFTVVEEPISNNHKIPTKTGNNEGAIALESIQIDLENLYEFAHNIICQLIKLAPAYKTNACKLFDSLYPYMIKDTAIQDAYIRNLLRVANTFKELRLMLLEVCIQKMLKIDVNSVASQIIEAELNNVDQQSSHEDNDDKIEIDNQDEENEEAKVNIPMKHPLADRLDVMMNNVFKFIDGICIDNTTNQINLESCKLLFKDLLFIFDKYLINTYGSSHVQFIMFYMCSFKPILSEAFVDYLWKKFCNINTNPITRQICAYYIGSFLSRAKYVPITTCVATLQLMITWLHNYIEKATTNKPNGSISTINYLDLHRTFYSLCQTVFYIIIFRNRQLFQPHHVSQNNHHHAEKNKEKDYSNLVRTWKLNELVTSKLNPLRYCLRSIRKKFARIAYINQIAYCYSIIDANNRLTIPISGQSSKQNLNGMFFSNQNDSLFLKEANCDANKLNKKSIEKRFDSNAIADNPLDSFFPFDPYLLSRSRIYVVKYYQEFQNVIDDDMELDDDDNESDSDDDDDDDEDDEDEDEEEEDELEDDTTEDEKNIRNDLERELRDDSDNDDENKNNLKLNRFTFNKNSNLYSNDEDD